MSHQPLSIIWWLAALQVVLPWLEFHLLSIVSHYIGSPTTANLRPLSSSISCTFVVAILPTEPCVSLDWFSYHHVTPAFSSYDGSQISKLHFRGQNFIYWASCLTRSGFLPPCSLHRWPPSLLRWLALPSCTLVWPFSAPASWYYCN